MISMSRLSTWRSVTRKEADRIPSNNNDVIRLSRNQTTTEFDSVLQCNLDYPNFDYLNTTIIWMLQLGLVVMFIITLYINVTSIIWTLNYPNVFGMVPASSDNRGWTVLFNTSSSDIILMARGNLWSEAKVTSLIAIWGEEEIQCQLDGMKWNITFTKRLQRNCRRIQPFSVGINKEIEERL